MRISDLKDVGGEVEGMASFYVSFSDLMMLLCVFFVMLLSMSRIELGSFEKIKTSFTGSTSGTLVELEKELKGIVEGVPGIPGVKVHLADDGVRLDLDTAALFKTGSAKLKSGSLDALKPILNKIRITQYSIDVEGHSDDLPLYRFFSIDGERTLETNWSLSGRRAASVIHFILKQRIPQNRVRLVGYASNRPLVSIIKKRGKALQQARSDNRRVSLLIR